jgi:zinc-ribbon domain
MFFRIGLPEVLVLLGLLIVFGGPVVALVVVLSATRRKKPGPSAFCSRCGAAGRSDAKFCIRCGAPR